MKALKEKYPQDAVEALLHLLEREEAIVEIAGLGWVGRETIEGLVDSVQSWFQANPKLTPGDFKQITGLSRKSAIPLLEWLDGRRITLRSGDHRVMGRAGKGFP